MSFILLEGLDRSGKSSVAKHYESKGYKVVHMSAPDKKYFRPDYSGESYLEEVVRMYSKYDGQNVVFDRTIYGELIWPNIYGRVSLLNEEDIEYLSLLERNNDAEKILMFDADVESHWQRCVENEEPLTRQQFGRANIFYERLVKDYGFVKKELPDFPEIGVSRSRRDDSKGERNISRDVQNTPSNVADNGSSRSSNKEAEMGAESPNKMGDLPNSNTLGDVDSATSIEHKLEKANAIRSLLQGAIIKKKGGVYDDLDASIRVFLQRELDEIFSPRPSIKAFNEDEITILKHMAQRVKDKLK